MSSNDFDEINIGQEIAEVFNQELAIAFDIALGQHAARLVRRKTDQRRRTKRRAKQGDSVKKTFWNKQAAPMRNTREGRAKLKVPRKAKKRLRYVQQLLTLKNPYACWFWDGADLIDLRGYLPVWRRALRLSRYKKQLQWLAKYDEGIAFSDRLHLLWAGEYDNDHYTDYVTTPLTYEPGTFEEECVGEVLSAPSTLAELGITNDVQFLRFLSTHTLPSHGR